MVEDPDEDHVDSDSDATEPAASSEAETPEPDGSTENPEADAGDTDSSGAEIDREEESSAASDDETAGDDAASDDETTGDGDESDDNTDDGSSGLDDGDRDDQNAGTGDENADTDDRDENADDDTDDRDENADTDDRDENADDDTDDRDDDIPVLDGSDADGGGALTKLDSDGPGGGSPSGSGGIAEGRTDDSSKTPPGAPPAEPTAPGGGRTDRSADRTPGGAPPSEPTRSGGEIRPDDEWTPTRGEDDSVTGTDADEAPAGPPDVEPAGPIDGPDDAESEQGCEASPPTDAEPGSGDPTPRPSSRENPDPGPSAPLAADAAGTGTTGGATPPSSPLEEQDDQDIFSGPPDDEEMPLTEHIEEMVGRLAAVAVIAAGVAVVTYPFSGDIIGQGGIITEMWYFVHPGDASACVDEPLNPANACAPPHVYSPLEYILTKLKFSGLVGLVVAIPFGVYQTYLFMRPGLYPNERRYYLASVPLSLVLAFVGIGFAFVVILPLLFEYFLEYTADTVNVAFQLSDTIDLMLVLMGWSALVFQIPLLMTLGVMMGITSRRWMERKRIYFWGGFGGIAFFFVAADPTGMASILLAVTMIVLFEVTLKLLKWTGR